jgi:hypothetical protein
MPPVETFTPAASRSDNASASPPDASLRGRWLTLAHVGWAILVIGPLALFAAAVPLRFDQLHQAASRAEQVLHQPAQAGLPTLLKTALSPDFYPTGALALEIALMAAFAVAACAIFWRKPSDRMAIFASITLVNFGAMTTPTLEALAAANPIWRFPDSLVQGVGLECELLIFYLSPNGRFVPHWTRLLAVVWTVWRVATLIFPSARFKFFGASSSAGAPSPALAFWFLVWIGWIGSALFAQVYRYRRESSPAQRQQTKWALIGVTVAAVAYVAFVLPRITLPFLSQPGPLNLLYTLIGTPLYLACLLVVPVCLAFSILRYRLWDVDILINRTLVYGTLTAILAAVYFGVVLGAQSIVQAVTGQAGQQPAIIVASTLLIAALFTPLRRGLQAIIDRRFYRRKYDAAKTLAAFGATLRTETDLAELRAQLVAVVQETMQPTQVSLWLRQPAQRADERAQQVRRRTASVTTEEEVGPLHT